MATKTAIACVLAWLVPGAGHIFLNRWQRGLVFLVVIAGLFSLGLGLDGQLFGFQTGFFGLLKFFAGVSTGVLYFVGRTMGFGVGNITSYGYEYGNTYLYTAGLLNMLLVVDAFDIARGRKN